MKYDLKKHLIQAITTNPSFSEAHVQLAIIYKEEKNEKSAIKHFKLAVSSYKSVLKEYDEKGNSLLQKSQFQHAKGYFIKSNDIRKHCSEVYYKLAVYYNELRDLSKVKFYLNNCVDLNPNHAKAYRDLGYMYFNNSQLDKSRLNLEKAINLDYSDSKSHFYLAQVMVRMNDLHDAEQHFLCSLDINPKLVESMVEIALLRLGMKDIEGAINFYLKAKNISLKKLTFFIY